MFFVKTIQFCFCNVSASGIARRHSAAYDYMASNIKTLKELYGKRFFCSIGQLFKQLQCMCIWLISSVFVFESVGARARGLGGNGSLCRDNLKNVKASSGSIFSLNQWTWTNTRFSNMENFAYLHLFLVKYILLVSQSFGFTSSSKCSDFSFFFWFIRQTF